MFSAILPLAFGLSRFHDNLILVKLLCLLTAVSLLADLSSFILINNGLSPNYAGSSYELVEFYLLASIYHQAFKQPNLLRILISTGVVYGFFSILNLAYIQRESINSYTIALKAIFFITLSVVYFYRLIRDMPTLQIHHLPMFWINAAVLFYFAGNFFLFILSDYLIKVMKNDLMVYWGFHNLVNITKNLLFAVGLWYSNRRDP
jgi:hypothetical protein